MKIHAELRNDCSAWSCAIGDAPPRAQSLRNLLLANYHLSLVKYSLGEHDVLTLRAHVPAASAAGRVAMVVSGFLEAAEMHESDGPGERTLTDHEVDDARSCKQALRLIGEVCTDNGWTWDGTRIGVPAACHSRIYLSVNTEGGNLIVSNELFECPERMGDEPSLALVLWLLRANSHVRYVNVSLTGQTVVLVSRLPFEQLTPDECARTVRAVISAINFCRQETQALLNHEIAVAYLRETAHHYYTQSLTQED